MASPQRHPLASLATKVFTAYSPDLNPIERIWLTIKARWFNNYVCKNEEQLLERLDQAILDVIKNPKKTQKTACIGTLL
ncbi:MAG: transposase [Desulfobacterales bacterium]|jgi:transposase